ncbi:hypothetical protein [Cohnella candidum]|uniref:hypothetical protein n=1 Tax=Cohnella candidum TaxID=2674991 RepID=UPI0013DDF020|nr:hypothetical protein [Cohnella candidum]
MHNLKSALRAPRMAFTLLLAAGLTIGLAACGSGGASNEAASSSPAAATASATPSGPAPSTSGAVTQGNPYEVAGITDPAASRKMFETVKDAAARNDKELAAENALYPIRVNVGKVAVEVKTKEDFVRQYDRIFTDKVRKALADQDVNKLFVNDEGVMAGNGEVWFGATADTPQRYGIVTVNVGEAQRY